MRTSVQLLKAAHRTDKSQLCIQSAIADTTCRISDVDPKVVELPVSHGARADNRPGADVRARQQASACSQPSSIANRYRSLSVGASRAVGVVICGENAAVGSYRDIVANSEATAEIQLCVPMDEHPRAKRNPTNPLQDDPTSHVNVLAHRPAEHPPDE